MKAPFGKELVVFILSLMELGAFITGTPVVMVVITMGRTVVRFIFHNVRRKDIVRKQDMICPMDANVKGQ